MKKKKPSYADLLKRVESLESRLAMLESRPLPQLVPYFRDVSGDRFPGPLPTPYVEPFTPYVPTITSPSSLCG